MTSCAGDHTERKHGENGTHVRISLHTEVAEPSARPVQSWRFLYTRVHMYGTYPRKWLSVRMASLGA